MKWKGKINFDGRPQYATDGLITSAEVDTISGSLQINVDGKSDIAHFHDDRYYTESEVDDLITTVSGKLDDHNEMNNLDYVSSGHIGFASSDTLSMASAVELTIVSGTVTCTQTLHRIDTEGDIATDDLDTILGGIDGDIIIIRAENGTRTVVLKDGTGNLKLGGRDLELIDTNMAVMLFYSGVLDQWLLIGDGGGSATAAVSDDAFSSAWDGGTAVAPSRNAVYDIMVTKSDLSHLHDDRYYTESEVDTISGALNTKIDGKSDTDHIHDSLYYTETELNEGQLDNRYYTESETDTISGSLQTNIDGKSNTNHLHDDRYYTETELNNGQLDNRYYTESEINTISGSLNTKINDKADVIHIHDDRYYTETEIDTISGSLQTNIDGKSDLTHLHDDRYYTETELNNGQLDTRYYTELEVDDLITTVSGKLDDHNEMNNLDYASAGHTGFQPSGDYATDSELTTLSGALKNDIDGKSDTSHLHDDRYYTESEIDSLITTFSGTIDHNTINNTHNLTTDIDHNQTTNYQIGEHRVINDSSSGSTNLWSAEKIETRVVTATGTLTQDHSGLYSLDYASSGHTGFQPAGDYLTDSEFSTYSGTLQSQIDGKSNTSHLHDDRYYTESEIDTISGSLNTSKSDVGHSHTESDISDLDKYTQVEVDGLITTISGKLDDHNELNNLDYASAGHTGFQPAGDYATDSELTTLSGNLQTNIDGKSDTTHLHDDRYYTETELNNGQLDNRYYTESEVNTISGSLQTNIDGKSDTGHIHDDRYYTESEVDTISGTLQTDIDTRAISGGAEHDGFSDFVANEHVDHSGVSITAGTGLTGGGNITATRTLDVDVGITDDKIVQIDDLDAADNDYCKLTASGIEGRNYSEVLEDLSESGQFALGEYGVKLDSLLSADGKYSGITCDGVLGATLAFGDLVYLNTADQRWELTDADAEATAGDVMLAIVLAAGNDGDTRLLLLRGFVREDDWNFTSYGQALFVSCIAGDMIQTVVSGTGDIVRVVGYASTFADQIYFNPSKTWLEIT